MIRNTQFAASSTGIDTTARIPKMPKTVVKILDVSKGTSDPNCLANGVWMKRIVTAKPIPK